MVIVHKKAYNSHTQYTYYTDLCFVVCCQSQNALSDVGTLSLAMAESRHSSLYLPPLGHTTPAHTHTDRVHICMTIGI